MLEQGHLSECSHHRSKGKQAPPAYWLCGWVTFGRFFLLIMGHIFLLLCMPGHFSLDAGYCEFCPLSPGYLCIPINMVEQYYGMQVSYLEMV